MTAAAIALCVGAILGFLFGLTARKPPWADNGTCLQCDGVGYDTTDL